MVLVALLKRKDLSEGRRLQKSDSLGFFKTGDPDLMSLSFIFNDLVLAPLVISVMPDSYLQRQPQPFILWALVAYRNSVEMPFV